MNSAEPSITNYENCGMVRICFRFQAGAGRQVHPAAAVGAEGEAGKQSDSPASAATAFARRPDLLYTVEGLLVDDGLMGVLEDDVLAGVVVQHFLMLV